MIKKFNRIIPNFLQVIILVVLAVYYLYQRLNLDLSIFNMLRIFLPALFSMGAVLYLLSRKKLFASHLILFIIAYLYPGAKALNDVLSFNFDSMQMSVTIHLSTIVYLLIFLYFIFILISYLLNNSMSGSTHQGKVIIIVFASLILFYLAGGFSIGLLMMLVPIISLAFGTQIASLLLVLAILIDIPFQVVEWIMNHRLFDQTLGYYVVVFIGLVLIFFDIKYLFKLKS